MSFDWEPKSFDFDTFQRLLLVLLVIAVAAGLALGAALTQLPAAAERSQTYELSMQEIRGALK